ncbi:MAG: response regulator transcription factor [Planctomycetes bacterium]|nr:response regulator transcription factor [Planctomycetota bacterium]
MSRILLVEDEEDLAEGLAFNLRNSGYDVEIVATGEDALSQVEARSPDLILLDVMLPGIDGVEVARRLRRSGFLEPIIMVTARNRSADAIAGLDAGADDFVTKPYDLDELLARIRGFLRRQVWSRSADEGGSTESLEYGRWTIDFTSYVARHQDGREERLTLKELAILRLLSTHVDEVVSRETFLAEVWGLPGSVETRTVDNFIRKIRQIFEEDPANPKHIVSVRGAGYRFVPEEA